MTLDLVTLSSERGIKVLQFIWGAMALSIVACAAIVWMVRGRAIGTDPGVLVAALGAVSAALVITQAKIHQNLKDEKLFPRILDLGSWGLKPETADRLQELQVPERGVQLILQAHVIFGVVIWALAEAVAAFGLVLSLISGDPRHMAVFGAAALVMLLLYRPKGKAFEEQITRWHRYVDSHRGQKPDPGIP